MNIEKTEKDKELDKAVQKFIENSDIHSMTELLVNWEEKSLLWLIFVESRLLAPSTTEDQANSLQQVREEALKDEKLLEKYENFISSFNTEDDTNEELEEDEYQEEETEDDIELTKEQKQLKKQLESLLEEASNLQYESIEKSIAAYKEAIVLMDENPAIKDSYSYLYSHYIMSFLYPQLGKGYDKEIVAYCRKGLAYVESIFVYAPFTEEGQFYMEAIRSCCNGIVWHSLEHTNTQEGLEELLDVVNKGCEYAQMSESPNIYGTKATLLLKLNRKEDAYRLAWRLKNIHANEDTHDEITTTKAYQEWEQSQDLKTADSFILSEEDCKNETAEEAYKRLLEAEKFIASNEDYNYFDEYHEYRENYREEEAEKITIAEIEAWESKYFKLEESFKNFVLKYGFISFGEEAYCIWKLQDYDNFGNALQREWGHSKEQVVEWFNNDYSQAENLYVCGLGDSGLQIHYYILMDKKGFYLFDQDDWYNDENPYTFDMLVSLVVNWTIEHMTD